MKNIFLNCLFLSWGYFFSNGIHAQAFFRAGQMSIDPRQVITENYAAIRLVGVSEEGYALNLFSKENIYTYLQLISDDKKTVYHILYQTSFTGHLLFLACSNNLSAVFLKKEKPMVLFEKCMQSLPEESLPGRMADKAVDCILERLNSSGFRYLR